MTTIAAKSNGPNLRRYIRPNKAGQNNALIKWVSEIEIHFAVHGDGKQREQGKDDESFVTGKAITKQNAERLKRKQSGAVDQAEKFGVVHMQSSR